ncbi:hypothetical protein [Streptomyces corynorhini]|uniref:Uncharacterized protein n=1 Tax=Streptomyces corynorhini TaxID=2282652 RepID=A0A370BCQ7_9ACTN|nr:hypothetical protein [Streptomyces corynorhini]RDG38442.1 hypothetical protein DVH02_09040 [Streptomyces corynorhini]
MTTQIPALTEPVPDLQLQMLIRLLGEDPGAGLPVTLNVPGGLVHGDLITRDAWKADWAEALHRVRADGTELLARFPEAVDEAVDEVRGEDGSHLLPRWIHLRKVTLTAAGRPDGIELPVWRGRLADVAGWALGRPE